MTVAPLTTILLVAALCAAVLGAVVATVVALALAALTEYLRASALRPRE